MSLLQLVIDLMLTSRGDKCVWKLRFQPVFGRLVPPKQGFEELKLICFFFWTLFSENCKFTTVMQVKVISKFNIQPLFYPVNLMSYQKFLLIFSLIFLGLSRIGLRGNYVPPQLKKCPYPPFFQLWLSLA